MSVSWHSLHLMPLPSLKSHLSRRPEPSLLEKAQRELDGWKDGWFDRYADAAGAEPFDSLPPEWEVLTATTGPETVGKHPTHRDEDLAVYTRLVRPAAGPAAGGWLLVAGLAPVVMNKDVVAAHETYTGLQGTVLARLDDADHDPHGFWAIAAAMLTDYNPDYNPEPNPEPTPEP